jgi:hypothetical protein
VPVARLLVLLVLWVLGVCLVVHVHRGQVRRRCLRRAVVLAALVAAVLAEVLAEAEAARAEEVVGAAVTLAGLVARQLPVSCGLSACASSPSSPSTQV